jgi:hypothetical protein
MLVDACFSASDDYIIANIYFIYTRATAAAPMAIYC